MGIVANIDGHDVGVGANRQRGGGGGDGACATREGAGTDQRSTSAAVIQSHGAGRSGGIYGHIKAQRIVVSRRRDRARVTGQRGRRRGKRDRPENTDIVEENAVVVALTTCVTVSECDGRRRRGIRGEREAVQRPVSVCRSGLNDASARTGSYSHRRSGGTCNCPGGDTHGRVQKASTATPRFVITYRVGVTSGDRETL